MRAISEKMVDMVAVKKVDSLSSAAGRSRQSAKMESLFSAESEKCWRCQLFPWIDYVAGIAVSRRRRADCLRGKNDLGF